MLILSCFYYSGIKGYRDDSLKTVESNSRTYQLPLTILSYHDLYGYSMDDIVKEIGLKNNCTYCGVFRRQALDRGAWKLGIRHIVTGHNADDLAETVLMNSKCAYLYPETRLHIIFKYCEAILLDYNAVPPLPVGQLMLRRNR